MEQLYVAAMAYAEDLVDDLPNKGRPILDRGGCVREKGDNNREEKASAEHGEENRN